MNPFKKLWSFTRNWINEAEAKYATEQKDRRTVPNIDLNTERKNAKAFKLNMLLELVRKYPAAIIPMLPISAEDLALYSVEAVEVLTKNAPRDIYRNIEMTSTEAQLAKHFTGLQSEHCDLDKLCTWYLGLSDKARQVSFEIVRNRIIALYRKDNIQTLDEAVPFFLKVSKLEKNGLSSPIWRQIDTLTQKIVFKNIESVKKIEELIQQISLVAIPTLVDRGHVVEYSFLPAYRQAQIQKIRLQRQADGVTQETLERGLDYLCFSDCPMEVLSQVHRILELYAQNVSISERYDLLMKFQSRAGYDLGRGDNSPLVREANALVREHPRAFADHPDPEVRTMAVSYV